MDTHDLYRVASSSASSARTVLHSSHPHHSPFEGAGGPRTATMAPSSRSSSLMHQHQPHHQPYTAVPHSSYMQQGVHPPHHHHHQSPHHPHGFHQGGPPQNSSPVAPVPPSRTSSLPAPRSPDGSGVPSVQVIHATPTKKGKVRRRSFGAQSDAGSNYSASGPPVGASCSGGMTRSTTLEVKMSEMLDDDPEEEDSDEERSRLEEARKARAREKGRERQRRKRERDKQAKEVRRRRHAVLLGGQLD